MITLTKKGGRTIELFLPFKVGEQVITKIELAPMSWGQTIDWREGKYQNSTELLLEVAGVSKDIIRSIKYPDADRVLMQFMDLLPPEIREDIASGNIPQPYSAMIPEEYVPTAAPEQTADEQPLEPELPLNAEDTPDMSGHPAYAKPDEFKKEEWDHILPQAAKPPSDDGLGFDLGENNV